MKLEEIRDHWTDWATSHGTDLRATTKTSTLKAIEIDGLKRAIGRIAGSDSHPLKVLEVGCGNGYNCQSLADAFPHFHITGMDYIQEMVDAALANRDEAGTPQTQLRFVQDDVMNPQNLESDYDIIYTDRCLINLNTDELQTAAISELCNRLKPGGHLLMIENSQKTYDNQNRARELGGLAPRSPAEFNHFYDEAIILPHLEAIGMDLESIEDLIGLHDLVLYVLVPMINDGKVDYDHPLVQAATRLNIAVSSEMPGAFGQFGQNRLYFCRKR